MVRHFHDHPGYIAALAAQVREHWTKHGRPDKLMMSFHGLPRYTLDKGDPYHCECQKTGRLLAEALQLAVDQWQLTFQSRFGRTEWLKPYTLQTLIDDAKQGVRRVDVICPGFVSDCLETLEEIGIECKEAFLSTGGREFHFIPCLNEREDWIRSLAEIALAGLGNWASTAWDADAARAEREQSHRRALSLGATS
jgi:ferrochelatase